MSADEKRTDARTVMNWVGWANRTPSDAREASEDPDQTWRGLPSDLPDTAVAMMVRCASFLSRPGHEEQEHGWDLVVLAQSPRPASFNLVSNHQVTQVAISLAFSASISLLTSPSPRLQGIEATAFPADRSPSYSAVADPTFLYPSRSF